jgi:hypothetical protein
MKSSPEKNPLHRATEPEPAPDIAVASSHKYLAVLVVMLVGFWGVMAARPDWLSYLGIRHFGVWFIDTYAILASNDARAQGLDVYAANPLDYFGRPHVYSPWWLFLGKLGFTRTDSFWLGCSLGLAFLAVAVDWLRPRSWGGLLWSLVALGSPCILMAVERANNDLVIFLLLAPVVPCLLAEHRGWQVGAILLIAVAAGLKFYPAAAALLLLAPAGSARSVRWRVAGGLLALALVAASIASGYLRVRHLLPPVDGPMNFGAIHALGRLGLDGVMPGFVAAIVIMGTWWRADIFRGWTVPAAARSVWLHAVLGAVVLGGCFFTSTNFAYRWVFALWLVPWLWWSAHAAEVPHAVRRLAWITAGLLAAALWIDPLTLGLLTQWLAPLPGPVVARTANLVYVLEQPFIWALFVCLLAPVTEFLRTHWRPVAGLPDRPATGSARPSG